MFLVHVKDDGEGQSAISLFFYNARSRRGRFPSLGKARESVARRARRSPSRFGKLRIESARQSSCKKITVSHSYPHPHFVEHYRLGGRKSTR
jgi:hypothetical protein